jgi:hypothetical protein
MERYRLPRLEGGREGGREGSEAWLKRVIGILVA